MQQNYFQSNLTFALDNENSCYLYEYRIAASPHRRIAQVRSFSSLFLLLFIVNFLFGQGTVTCTFAWGTVQVTSLRNCQYGLFLQAEVVNFLWIVNNAQPIPSNPITVTFPGNRTFPVSVTSNSVNCTETVNASGCSGAAARVTLQPRPVLNVLVSRSPLISRMAMTKINKYKGGKISESTTQISEYDGIQNCFLEK